MNKIQKDILKKLSLTEKAKYSKIKPKNIEGNTFSYHLKSLIKSEMIKKEDDDYSLTSSGKFYLQKLRNSDMNVRPQPLILTLTICKNKNEEFLLYKRTRQPEINRWGFPAGKIHENEPLDSSAKREFFEKTGLSASPKHKGLIYLTLYDNKSNITFYSMTHVFYVEKDKNFIKKGDENSNLVWVKKRDLKKMELVPGAKEILGEFLKNEKKGKKSKDLFYKELFIHL